jgi:sulfur-oxidizing protein SoxY
MQGLLGSAKPISSDLIDISTPELAENGANVPVEIKTAIPNSEVIYLFAEKNPFPAVAEFMLSPEVESFVSCRVKLAETGYLVVVVRADGRLFSARKPVTVVTGGCAT